MRFELYTIRLCRRDEYEELVDFFGKYWSKNHVFCRNKEIFEFQHGDASNGEYDFIIAVHNETNEIHAVRGFISSSRYDGGDFANPVSVSGALWKVRDDVQNKEVGKLGLGVLYYLLKHFPESAYISLGLSVFSQQIYDALHFDFGLMKHYYIASKYMDEFYIASDPFINSHSVVNEEYKIKCINAVPDDFDSYYYPTKNREYIVNRYLNHPFYEYKLAGIFQRGELLTIWVIREIEVDGHRCVRLVDVVGNMEGIQDIEGNVHEFLQNSNSEFVDCYNHGIKENIFFGMGFRQIDGDTVIPNYFEPFEKKNVDIHYAAHSKKSVVIFKGDSDQDRPNLLDVI